jgi:putative tryptophan/tyrosine transport system substrate-binding protein
MFGMKRREFIRLLGGAAVAWPLAARAQQPVMPVIGFLCSGSPTIDASRVASVRKGLRQAGYIEGRNLTIEYRWAEEQYDRLTALAADLARRPVSVIVAIGTTPAAVAAKAATTVVPTVFVIGADPVKLGLVASLNRPGGNLTGVSFLNRVLVAKQFEMLHEAAPTAEVSGFLVNPSNPFADFDIGDARAAAATLRRKLLVAQAATENEIDTAFTTLAQQGVGSLLVAGDLLLHNHRGQIIALAARHAIPVLYPWREATVAGGLMSYGADLQDAFRLGGIYAGKILSGEKPAELPIEQATKVELVINLKTAKTLGLDVPLKLLAFADEVIE